MRTFRVLVALAAWWFAAAAAPAPAARAPLTLEQLRAARKQLAQRRRRIIMNNDGCDVLYYPKNEPVTIKRFLTRRTTPLAWTQVDAIAYCSISSGFSFFTHDTKVGTLLTRSGYEYGILPKTRNISKDLIDLGADCLRAVVRFGHRRGMEVFWSMRMNDTHDVAYRPDRPYLLYPPLKVQHPDWLVGDPIKRTPYGRWSSVDYARPEIRDLAFRFIQEVCENYDVDGVELDFFRHLCYFKSTAFGRRATDAERGMMTDLMRRIRRMTERVGMRRGRPILVSIRVPDSVGYCRDMGFDLERWLQEDLVDILITTGYFRLNPWKYTVDLAHRYAARAYPCLSDSRVRGQTRFRRGSTPGYRGRAMNAWLAGADGVHLFNYFNPRAAIWKEIGDPETLLTLDKLYFVTVRDGDPRWFLANGREYRRTPVLTPSHPMALQPGAPLSLPIVIGDDFAAARRKGCEPRVALHLALAGVGDPRRLHVKLNAAALPPGEKKKGGWFDFSVDPNLVKRGENRIEITVDALDESRGSWSVVFDGDRKPARPWRRDRGSKRTIEKVVDGALLIADRGTVSGDYLYYRYYWGAQPSAKAVVEARVKVKSGSSFIIFANNVSGERLGLYPDRIQLYHHPRVKYAMDTTSAFHVYRVEVKGADVKVFVDGVLRLDAPGALKPRRGYPRNEVAFGAANSTWLGEAYWDYVKVRGRGGVCADAVVSVAYKKR